MDEMLEFGVCISVLYRKMQQHHPAYRHLFDVSTGEVKKEIHNTILFLLLSVISRVCRSAKDSDCRISRLNAHEVHSITVVVLQEKKLQSST